MPRCLIVSAVPPPRRPSWMCRWEVGVAVQRVIAALAGVVGLLTVAAPVAGQTGEWRALRRGQRRDEVHTARPDRRRQCRRDPNRVASSRSSPMRPGWVVSATRPARRRIRRSWPTGRLYISTGLGTVAALDAATGEVIWVGRGGLRGRSRRRQASRPRGVAYWDRWA